MGALTVMAMIVVWNGSLFSYVDLEARISERQLMEQMQYNLLFRWIVGLRIDDLPLQVPAIEDGQEASLLSTAIPCLLPPNKAARRLPAA